MSVPVGCNADVYWRFRSGGYSNLLALQKILGHSEFEMMQIYSHLAPDYIVAEIARLTFCVSLLLAQ